MFYEIENLILGNIVQDPKKYFEHSQMFNPLMFEDVNNLFIYNAFVKIVKKGNEPDLISINRTIGQKKSINTHLVNLCSVPIMMPKEFQSGLQELYETSQRKMVHNTIIDINNSLQNHDSIDKVKSLVDTLQSKFNSPNRWAAKWC